MLKKHYPGKVLICAVFFDALPEEVVPSEV